MNIKIPRWVLPALLFLHAAAARGQWTTQTVSLQPGWNAVYLEVQPQPSDCDTALAGLGVEKVCGWNRRFSPVQYIQSATEILPAQPDWLFYVPATHPLAAQKSLFNLEGGKCYLIKLPDHAAPTRWVVLGQPTLRQTAWVPNSLNLVGFALDLAHPPTFTQFFSPSPAHANHPVYRLTGTGAWVTVTNLAGTTMRSGEAFWISCTGGSTYQGPIALTVPQRSGLTFGSAAVQQNLTIQNLSSVPRDLIFTLLPSAGPPAGKFAPLAGSVPLSFWKLDLANKVAAWLPLKSDMAQSNLAAGQSAVIKWAVRRSDMAANQAGSGALYQSLLEIRDAAGSSRLVVPVTAAPRNGSPAGAGPADGQPRLGTSAAYPGLWIGTATINRVNEPGSLTDPTLPTNTATPFQFRLITHVGATTTNPTNVLFMQRVLEMWQNGTHTTNSTGGQVVNQPGTFILLTDESFINSLTNVTGAAMRDGQFVGRRVSTAAFGFRSPIVMTNFLGTGDFGVSNSVYGCTVSLDYNDPLNPFKHLYHPDHDNTNAAGILLPAGVQSFTINRHIKLTFTASDPDNLASAGWGDNRIGGIYQETITGLQAQTNYIQGTFRLSLASSATGLNGNP